MTSEADQVSGGDKRLINELKKLEISVNYDRKDGGQSHGGRRRGKWINIK